MREIRRTYRIRREVSLISRFISCKYSSMLFVIYISFYYSIQPEVSWKGHRA